MRAPRASSTGRWPRPWQPSLADSPAGRLCPGPGPGWHRSHQVGCSGRAKLFDGKRQPDALRRQWTGGGCPRPPVSSDDLAACARWCSHQLPPSHTHGVPYEDAGAPTGSGNGWQMPVQHSGHHRFGRDRPHTSVIGPDHLRPRDGASIPRGRQPGRAPSSGWRRGGGGGHGRDVGQHRRDRPQRRRCRQRGHRGDDGGGRGQRHHKGLSESSGAIGKIIAVIARIA